MTDEIDFTHHVLGAIGRSPEWRVHRQNCGQIPVRDRAGRVLRYFHPGPPNGAADISGIVRPEGWRLELELKMPKGKRSKAQIAWARMVEAFGGVYVLYTYDADLPIDENVARAAAAVHDAIARRRGP